MKLLKKLFEPLFNRYQIGLETSMRDSDFIFDCVHFLYCICHKISFKGGVSYVDPPDQIKKAAKNPINKKDNKCFQCKAH